MDKRLADRRYLGDYFDRRHGLLPLAVPPDRYGQNRHDFPHVKRWWNTMHERPAMKRAYEVGSQYRDQPATDPEVAKILFGQRPAAPSD